MATKILMNPMVHVIIWNGPSIFPLVSINIKVLFSLAKYSPHVFAVAGMRRQTQNGRARIQQLNGIIIYTGPSCNATT